MRLSTIDRLRSIQESKGLCCRCISNVLLGVLLVFAEGRLCTLYSYLRCVGLNDVHVVHILPEGWGAALLPASLGGGMNIIDT